MEMTKPACDTEQKKRASFERQRRATQSGLFIRFLPACASNLFTSLSTFLSHALVFLVFFPSTSNRDRRTLLMDRSVSSQPLFAGPARILCALRLNAARFFAMFLFWTEDLAGRLWRCDCEAAPSAHRVVRGRQVHPGRCSFGSKPRGFVFNTNPSAPRIGLPLNLPSPGAYSATRWFTPRALEQGEIQHFQP
jgi:hypothetical protein